LRLLFSGSSEQQTNYQYVGLKNLHQWFYNNVLQQMYDYAINSTTLLKVTY